MAGLAVLLALLFMVGRGVNVDTPQHRNTRTLSSLAPLSNGDCKVMCQRFAFALLGDEFKVCRRVCINARELQANTSLVGARTPQNIAHPNECVKICDKVYPEVRGGRENGRNKDTKVVPGRIPQSNLQPETPVVGGST